MELWIIPRNKSSSAIGPKITTDKHTQIYGSSPIVDQAELKLSTLCATNGTFASCVYAKSSQSELTKPIPSVIMIANGTINHLGILVSANTRPVFFLDVK